PVAAVAVVVVAAVLQEHPDGLGLLLADPGGVAIAAAQAHVGADGAEDPAELTGPLPGRGECGDGAAAAAADGPVVPALGQDDGPAVGGALPLHLGQQ